MDNKKNDTPYKGYLGLLEDFKRYQKQTPKGVSLENKKNKTIQLRFKINNKAKARGCNCTFTLDGMVSALSKSHKVAEALKKYTSETEFWEWYDREILEKGKIENDLMTFSDAIAIIEKDFWTKTDRRKQKRSKDNPSNVSCWNQVYKCFYEHLPQDKVINKVDMLQTLERWKVGTKRYQSAVSVFKRLARTANKKEIVKALDRLDTTQTEFKELQTITLTEFLEWRDRVLGITSKLHKNCDLEVRKAWLWVFSIQIIYGLRIHEVFSIKNLDKPFTTKDKVIISPLNDASNTTNLLVIGTETELGTTTKTGYRLATPLIGENLKYLFNQLEIKDPQIPSNKPKVERPDIIRKFYAQEGRNRLERWKAPITQTHAFRHLSNLLGIQSGIPQEIRAQSLGHSVLMNETIYKKRQATQTTIDILTSSNKQPISLNDSVSIVKRAIEKYPDSRLSIIETIAKIYQTTEVEIIKLIS